MEAIYQKWFTVNSKQLSCQNTSLIRCDKYTNLNYWLINYLEENNALDLPTS